jgi:hypothetical protein
MASNAVTPDAPGLVPDAGDIDFTYKLPRPLDWIIRTLAWLIGSPYTPFKFKDLIRNSDKLAEPRYAGLSSPEFDPLLLYHRERARVSTRVLTPIVFVIQLSLMAAFAFPTVSVVERFNTALSEVSFRLWDLPPDSGEKWLALGLALGALVGLVLAFLLLYILTAGITMRVYFVIFGKRYAPSMCVNSIVLVNFFLLPENALTQPELKKKLLAHISDLAQNTMLLPLCFRSTDAATQRKTFKHFKELESFVRERERWAIAPAEQTLADLRRDFKALASIYITGRYGLFHWQDAGVEEPAPESRWKGVSAALLRLVGVVLPLGLMGAYLWKSALFPGVDVDKKVVGLIFIAWLLLALDAGLKLGVVSQLTSIAKGIKDLK